MKNHISNNLKFYLYGINGGSNCDGRGVFGERVRRKVSYWWDSIGYKIKPSGIQLKTDQKSEIYLP